MHGKTIVIAVDDSPASRSAVEAGLELADALGSAVRFVHAFSPLAEDVLDGRRDPFAGPSDDEIVARDPVLAAAAERASRTGVEYEIDLIADARGRTTEARKAALAADVAGIADGLDAALIVVGSRGRGSITGAMLGSVSHNLVKLASVPVLVVHADARDVASDDGVVVGAARRP